MSTRIQDVPHKLVLVLKKDIEIPQDLPYPIEISQPDEAAARIEYIEHEMHNNMLCKGVNKSYIHDAFDAATFFVYLTKTTRPRTIEGLMIVQDRDDETFYVDILCGSSTYGGVGSLLLDFLYEMTKKLGKTNVTLSSLTQSVGFYIKKGFEFTSPCPMTLKVRGGGRRKTRRLRRKRRANKTRKLFG
jgi:hypothetical protein